MYRQQISQKASPSPRSTSKSKAAPIPSSGSSYESLSSVVQRAQQDPESVSKDERQQLESAIGTRSTQKILTGKQNSWAPEFKGISEQLWGDWQQAREPIQAKEKDNVSVSEVQKENKTGLPDNLKAGIENLSGIAMDDVRVHYNSSNPAKLQALAYTQGTDIHVAPRQEKHLAHEAWHVVQQKQGRVKPTIQAKGVGINNNEGLETEADVMGGKAKRGEYQPKNQGKEELIDGRQQVNGVVQAKLGFELELLVLVDVHGRPAIEKIPLGTVGNHLELTADQNASVEADTPSPAATVGNYQTPYKQGLLNLGNYDLPAGWTISGAVLFDKTNNMMVARYNSILDAQTANNPLPDGHEIKLLYQNPSGEETLRHPFIGMGMDKYASILEIVTKPYEPETVQGAANILQSMQDAVVFANAVNPHHRTQLSTIDNVTASSDEIYIGNDNQPNQTVDASIQTTIGLDIAQLPSFVKSSMAYMGQSLFNTKHDSDIVSHGITTTDRAKQEIPRAISDATAIINSIGHDSKSTFLRRTETSSIVNLRGLITLICQYLRMGKYAYNNGKWTLDKNLTPLLSRTDLGQIYQNLPEEEKTWLRRHKKTVRRAIYAQTGRAKHSTVFTDPTETEHYTHIPVDVQGFINNVFSGNADGITGNLGGFHQINAENIDPYGNRDGREQNKLGPVFEIRNMIPTDESLGNDRFDPNSWEKLARYFIEVLAFLNQRTDTDATTDTRVRTHNTTGAFIRSDNEPRSW